MTSTAKRIILTGAFVGITATGAIYGAQLKTQQQTDEAIRKQKSEGAQSQGKLDQKLQIEREAERERAMFVSRRIVALESQKAELLRQKTILDNKLANLHIKMDKNQQKQAIRDQSMIGSKKP